MIMASSKRVIQLLLIILFSFIIILNSIHLLPAFNSAGQFETFSESSRTSFGDTIDTTIHSDGDSEVDSASCISRCLMDLDLFPPAEDTGSSQSLCGPKASSRGNHQKVVAFSFYGDMKHGYFQGITDNLDLMQERKGCLCPTQV